MIPVKIVKIIVFFSLMATHDVAGMAPARRSFNPYDATASIRILSNLKRVPKHTPYKKFAYAYYMFNVCALRYEQKREICSTILSTKKYNALLLIGNDEEYANLLCKKRIVDVSEAFREPRPRLVLLSTYKCPRPYQVQTSHFRGETFEYKYYLPVYYFISGGIQRYSAIVGYRHVGAAMTTIKPVQVVYDFPITVLRYWYLVDKNRPYERTFEYLSKKFTEPMIMRKDEWTYPIFRNAVLAEGGAIQNDKVKRYKPYEKFEQTYNKLNICSLIKQDKVELCRQAFGNLIYRFLISDDQDELICGREKLTFSAKVYQSLTVRLSIIRCSITKDGTKNSFFVTTSLRTHSIITLMQINPFPEILPDALITEVDVQRLEGKQKFYISNNKPKSKI